MVGYFGYTGIPERGKTPKVYYLKRRGWELLQQESQGTEISVPYVEVYLDAAWSPQMYHRLRLLDLVITLEAEVRERESLSLVRTFIEYRRVNKTHVRKTTDYVAQAETSDNRIVPAEQYTARSTEGMDQRDAAAHRQRGWRLGRDRMRHHL
jgi:hypothetical protein